MFHDSLRPQLLVGGVRRGSDSQATMSSPRGLCAKTAVTGPQSRVVPSGRTFGDITNVIAVGFGSNGGDHKMEKKAGFARLQPAKQQRQQLQQKQKQKQLLQEERKENHG